MLNTTLTVSRGQIKIGALLVKAGVVRPEAVSTALDLSKRQDQPLGTVLVRMCKLRKQDLASALYLQSLVNEGILAPALAISALNLCYTHSIEAKAALTRLNWQPEIQEKMDPICELMLQSEFINRRMYQEVMTGGQQKAFSFVLRGVLTCAQFNEVLRVATLMNQQLISKEDAIAALAEYRKSHTAPCVTLKSSGAYVRGDRALVGQLMIAAGVINESQLLLTLEQSVRDGVKIGEQLVKNRLMSANAMQACLDAQKLLACGVLNWQQTVWLIKNSIAQNLEAIECARRSRIITEHDRNVGAVVTLLQHAQIITQADLDNATTTVPAAGPVAALAISGRISKDLYESCWKVQALVDAGEMRAEQAIVLLQLCERMNCSFEEAREYLQPKEAVVETVSAERSARQRMEEQAETRPLPQQEIVTGVLRMEKQKRLMRSVELLALLVVAGVTLFAVHRYMPGVPEEYLYAGFGLCLVLQLTRLVSWERQDKKRTEELTLTAEVARRSHNKLRKVSR